MLNDRGAITWEGSAYDDWMAIPAIDDKCRQCSFLPMCMGGCRKTRMFTGKSGPDCTLPFVALESACAAALLVKSVPLPTNRCRSHSPLRLEDDDER